MPSCANRFRHRDTAPACTSNRAAITVHHVRDVTMKEDAQRLRADTSAQVTATLWNTAVAALRPAGFSSAAAGRRWADRNPARPLAALNLI
jgi:hypothetical protein